MVGLIEGVGEATASISKLFCGWLSDRRGKRKALTIIGYGLGALSKPLFAIASTAHLVLFARFSDRVGKGIRGAPRGAMVGDLVPVGQRGAAYGLRQALDTVGAFAGPLLAMLLMAALHDSFRLIFWVAVIPGLISVAILIFGVREPPHTPRATQAPIKLKDLKSIDAAYWIVVGVGTVAPNLFRRFVGHESAFGLFNFASGVTLLLASLIAGLLWEQIGPSGTFFAGAIFTALGLLALSLTRPINPVK